MENQYSRDSNGIFTDAPGGGSGSNIHSDGIWATTTTRLQYASKAQQDAAGINQWDNPADAERKLQHKSLMDQFSASSASYQSTDDNPFGKVIIAIFAAIFFLGVGLNVLSEILKDFWGFLGFVVVPLATLAVILCLFVYPKTIIAALLAAFLFLHDYYGFSIRDLYYETRNAYFDYGSFASKLERRHKAANGDVDTMLYLADKNLNRKNTSDFEREQAYSWIISAVRASKDEIIVNGWPKGYWICYRYKANFNSAEKIGCLNATLESTTAPYAIAVSNFQLGEIYSKELAGEENKSQGIYFYSKAADAGLKEAQKVIAQAYLTGSGVQRDNEKAAYWTARFNSNKCRRDVTFCPQS